MGRPEEPLDRSGSPVREFAFWLRDLRRQTEITYEQLAGKAHYAVSTMQAAAAGKRLPTLRVTLAFVAACGGDQQAWRAYWTRVRRVLDAAAPPDLACSVSPPWADSGSPSAQVAEAAPAVVPGRDAVGETGGWFIESYSAVVRVGTELIEVIARRTIVATVDNLREIVTSVSVPRPPDALDRPTALESELLFGGSLERRGSPYDGYFTNVIALPRSLGRGDRHEYGLRLAIPPGQRMASHFLHVPYRRSDHFDLRLRFGHAVTPRRVWLLDGVPGAALHLPDPAAPTLYPDRFGEIHATFDAMRPGLGYGVRWLERG